MIIGVPKEIKPDERRVGLTPSGVAAFVTHKHHVLVEKGAGLGSGLSDEAYEVVGGELVDTPQPVWEQADLIIKVKEPVGEELNWMHPGQILFTYLHLASNEPLVRELLKNNVTAMAYETIQLEDGSLPVLAPMSEVAGRLAVQKGAQCLEAGNHGRGILLGGISGVKPAHVVILGAGVAGSNACFIAQGMGAHVTVLDINPSRLRYLHDIMGGHVITLISNTATIREEAVQADLIIGTVLVTGARAPQLITRDMVAHMRSSSVIVDVAIDQGGCCATSHPTTHHEPTYLVDEVVHYCVANMPAAVPRTSTYALSNATLGYGLALADKGLERALNEDPALCRGLNLYNGAVTYKAVADALGMEWQPYPG